MGPLRRGSPLRRSAPAPLNKGSLGVYKTIKPSRQKVQTGKSGLHLLLMADIQRQLLTNLVYRIRRRVAKTRKVTTEWNAKLKHCSSLNSEAESTKRNQAPLFSPIFSGKTEKIGPSET